METKEEKDLKMIHECNYYSGRISDVTVRRIDGRTSIHCRRCGEALTEEQVDPKMLKQIKSKNEQTRRTNRGRDNRRR